jgi:hypothetical protein
VDAAEELGVGGGAASGHGGEGTALAEETAESDGVEGVGGDLRFLHKYSKATKRDKLVPGYATVC